MISRAVLLDTGIVLRYITGDHAVIQRVGQLKVEYEILVCPQVLYEFWVVATRPKGQNGLGLMPAQASHQVYQIVNAFILLPDPEDLWERWVRLCTDHSVSGRQAHDARIVAWMDAYSVSRLYTLNPSDFARYQHIQMV